MLEHKAFLSVGHDEYWSGASAPTSKPRARRASTSRSSAATKSSGRRAGRTASRAPATPYRTLVCYKETHANAKIDPLPTVWTGTWADPRFSPPADGGRPENAFTGTLFTRQLRNGALIRSRRPTGKMRFWRNTAVATLAPDQSLTLTDGTLGYEWDEDVPTTGSGPPGLFRLSDTDVDSSRACSRTTGRPTDPRRRRTALTLYRHASGALVFGAGTVQWSWGLDSNHDRGSAPPSLRCSRRR